MHRPARTLLLAATVGATLTACDSGANDAFPPDGPVPPETLAELARTAHEDTRVRTNADTLFDAIGPRVSALPSGGEARAFVQRRLEAYGVPEVREEPFPLLAWDRRGAALEVVGDGAAGADALAILSLGHVGSHEVEGPLVDAGHGTAEEIEALGEDAEGAIVLADVGSPSGYGRGVHRTEKVTLATRAGATGFIQVNTSEGPLVPVGVATMGDEETEIPAVATDRATGEHLRSLLAEREEVRLRLEVENWMERAESANVLGEIPGRTDEVVLVGAHLDSWDLAVGAVDNGSGSLAVLDIARALAAHVRETGETPLRTIRFAFWMGEELGLYGSRHHVAARVEDGTLADYTAILNLDVIGAPVGLGAMGRPEAASLLERVRQGVVRGGFELREDIGSGGGLYSDHQPFVMEGVPVLTVASRQRPEASGVGHTSADVRDVVDEPGIARTAAVSSALLWAIANEPDPGLDHWAFEETGRILEELGHRDPLERAGDWRW